MNNNEFVMKLLAQLDKQNSKKQINVDIKQLESVIRKIGLIGTFSKGATKKELNAYITQLGNQLQYLKLQAKVDNKQLKREMNETLKSLSFADIDVGVNEHKTKTKVKKVVADAKAVMDRNPLSLNIEVKKDKLDNQLTTYLNKNSKIKESAVLLEEADKLRKVFSNIGDKNSLKSATDQFQLFKSEVVATGFAGKSTTQKISDMVGHITKIGTAFGVASAAINQFMKSERNLREIDTVLTEISKTSEMTKKQLMELGDASFDTANKYGQLAKNYLLGVQEMARSGYEDKAKELGEISLLAQSAGDMSAEMANNYILATDAAYKYGGSIEMLTSALDGANYVSNKNSASLTDIADGIRVSASYAANAGVKIDELTAAEATMIATTKRSGSEMGRAFRSILLNLQQVKGEFDGEIIDEESLKKVEARCHSLGVELETMTNEGAKLRNPMEVLKELSQVYNSLPESSVEKQGLISDLGGKYHANALTALLSRWDLYEKMLSEYSQGSGSALVEANKTADSWEGRLNQLQNSWDSFVNSLTSKSAVKGGISFLDNTIQTFEKLTDTIGAIPTLLTAVNASMSTLNKDYGITQLFNQDTGKMDIQGNLMGIDFTAIKAQKKHFEEAAEAMTQWNDKLTAGKGDLEQLGISIVKNNAQLRTYLATTSKDAPASLAGYKSYLNAAGVSTDALRLKTILLTSALSFGIGAAIQIAVSGITKLIQAQEESRQAAQEAANVYDDTTKSISDYAKRYEDLHSALLAANGNEEDTYSIKKQLLDLQTELNDKFGDEYGRLNLVADAYKDQTEVIKAYNKEAAKTLLNDISRSDQNKAINKMAGKKLYNLSAGGTSGYSDEGKALQSLTNEYKGKGISSQIDEYGALRIYLTADPTSAEETINAFMSDVSALANQFGDEHIFDEVLNISKSAKDEAQKTISDWGDIYKKTLLGNIALDDGLSSGMEKATQAVKDYNEAVLRSEDPYNDKNVQEAYTALKNIQTTIQNDDSWGRYKSVMDSVWDSADTKLLDLNDAINTNKDGISQFVDKIKDIDDADLKAKIDSQDSDIYIDLAKYADQYQMSVSELSDALISLGYAQKQVESPETKDVQLFNIQDEGTAKTIDEFQKKMSALSEAIEKAKNNKLTSSDLLDLQQDFPTLIDSTEDLDIALMHLVDHALFDLVNYLGQSGASTNLVNTFRDLADEAKGLGSDWTTTFNAFDNVESKMGSLAGLINALGNQYTITAAEARKFAEVFPDLLSLGEATSTGLIQFDKAVIDSFVNGKQVEIQADRDAQIAQLENKKAVLEAKRATAQAALDLVAAQASGEIDAENQKNERLAEASKNLKQYLVDLGIEEGNADAVVKELMAGNIKEYDRVVAEVSNNVDSNLTDSINEAAENVNIQSRSMIDSLFGIAQQAHNAARAVISIGTGNPVEAIKAGIDTAAKVGKKFNATEYSGDFKRLVNEGIKVDDYKKAEIKVDLELKVDNYNKAINGLDAQIALLKSSGEKSLSDYLADLKDNSSSKSNSKKDSEIFNWMERRIQDLNDQIENLKGNIDTLIGYEGKNKATDSAIALMKIKLEELGKMYDAYMEKANSFGLDEEYAKKVREGTISIEEIDPNNKANEALIEQINSYQTWYERAVECKDQILETTEAVKALNLSKLDNIIEQFNTITDIQSQLIDSEKQLLDLREKQGETIDAEDYISLAEKQLESTRLNIEAYNRLSDEMAKLNIERGTEEWKKYNDQLQDLKNNMISAADAVESYKDAMTALIYKDLNDFKSQMDSINGTIDTMSDLIGTTNLVDDDGLLTDRGLAQMALYAQQLSNAKQEAAEYDEAIRSLDEAYGRGLITQDEYNSMLHEYKSAQESAVSATKAARDAILALVKEGIQAEIDAKKKLVDETKAALDAERDLHEYQQSIADKQGTISKLQRQIAALSNSTDRKDIAQRIQLQQQLADAQKDLYETQYDHELEQRKEALDNEYEAFEESKNKEMDELDSNLDKQEGAINKYLEQVKKNHSTAYEILKQYGKEYNLTATDDLTDPWKSAGSAADLCSDAIGNVTANIQYEIDNLDFDSLYELIDLLNTIGEYGYGDGDATASQWEDISGTGKWQKSEQSGRWWYGSDEDNYASGGIYTIDGKQYGFNDKGQMVTGWRNDIGDGTWRYFEPENGQMVRSSWRKSKDGDWYYLDKNGMMATNMAVKAKNDDGYYYVDDDGKMEEGLLSYEDVKRLGHKIGYKNGTRSATPGWHRIDEEGLGSETIITKDGQVLHPFMGDETVFSKIDTKKLWDITQNPAGFINGAFKSEPQVEVKSISQNVNVNMNIGGVLDETAARVLAQQFPAMVKKNIKNISDGVAEQVRWQLKGK